MPDLGTSAFSFSDATHEDGCATPIGALIHRVCQCPHFQAQQAQSGCAGAEAQVPSRGEYAGDAGGDGAANGLGRLQW